MLFDECTAVRDRAAAITGEAEARASMELIAALGASAARDEFARLENPNALFGIVQGGMFENLREESVAALRRARLAGLRDRRRRVGEPKEEMQRIVAHTPHRLPARQAALPDGRRHAGGSGRRRRAPASTCSTA